MLDLIRNNRKIMLVLLVFLVFPSFVIFGVNFDFGGGNSNDLAHVGKNPITAVQLKERLEVIRRNNPNVDLRELDQPEVKLQVLRGIIEDTLWQTAAHGHRLVVSDPSLRQELLQHPILEGLVDEKGQIDTQAYRALLGRMGYRDHDFENLVLRPEIMAARMKLPVRFGFTSRVDVEQYMQFVGSRYVLRQQTFNFEEYVENITVTPEELLAHYEKSKHLFVTPASVDIEYVVFDGSKLGDNLSGDALRAYYEQNKEQLNLQEERRISHVLLTGDDAKQKAEALLVELRQNPSRFAEVAEQQSEDKQSAVAGGDLGYIAQGILAPLDQVAFALKNVGDIADVVESPVGYHIVMLTDVKTNASFDALSPSVMADLRKSVATPLSTTAAEHFVASVAAQSDSFDAVAKEFGLQIEQARNIAQQPAFGASGVLGNADFLNAVFNANALNSSKNIMPVKVGATQLASARVLTYVPEAVKPFAEVEDQVKAMIVQEKAIAQAQVEAQKLLEQWKETPEMANEAGEVSFTQGEVIQWMTGIQQQQVDLNVMLMLQEIFAVAEKAFQYSSASDLPESFVVELPGRGYIAAQLQRIELPEEMDEALLAQSSIGLGEVVTDSQKGAMLGYMEKEYNAGLYPETIQRLSEQ